MADIRRHVHRDSKELLREVHRHAVNVSSALITGGIVMNVTLAFALFSILLIGTPGYAQNSCVDCLQAAQERLTQCLGNAISQEDKKSCVERQQKKTNTCESGACVIERAKIPNKDDVLSKKSGTSDKAKDNVPKDIQRDGGTVLPGGMETSDKDGSDQISQNGLP
jgi:hypothetical protein